MPEDKNNIIPEVSFPTIPEDIDEEMKMYLTEFEIVLREALKGSLFLNKTLEDGIFGN